jgi:hypothetical protein
MATENGTQAGNNAGAAMNDVAAVIRRLIAALGNDSATGEQLFGSLLLDVFETKTGLTKARTDLQKLLDNPGGRVPVGTESILRYLGQGDPKRSPLSLREVRDAVQTLKMSGKYADIVDHALAEVRQRQFAATGAQSESVELAQTAKTLGAVSSMSGVGLYSRMIFSSQRSARR